MSTLLITQLIENFEELSKYCVGVYRGGSRVDPVINTPHDYDYICFSKPLNQHFLLNWLRRHKFISKEFFKLSRTANSNKNIETFSEDFSQIRVYPYTQITWFSYLDVLMQKVIGEDICPKTDIIKQHRQDFIVALKEKMTLLLNGVMKNQKRWYHLLRGAYILVNNSYEVSEEQKKEINILHDLTEGWDEIRDKTIQIVNSL